MLNRTPMLTRNAFYTVENGVGLRGLGALLEEEALPRRLLAPDGEDGLVVPRLALLQDGLDGRGTLHLAPGSKMMDGSEPEHVVSNVPEQ